MVKFIGLVWSKIDLGTISLSNICCPFDLVGYVIVDQSFVFVFAQVPSSITGDVTCDLEYIISFSLIFLV